MLVGLRTRFDAVMIGAGTMRAERYGRIVADQEQRERRERLGLPHDPLMVIVSGRLDLPWDAPLFTDGGGRGADLHRLRGRAAGDGDLAARSSATRAASTSPRRCATCAQERGVRALLCEGGPRLHAELEAAGLVDELFLTIAPKLAGGDGAAHPRGRRCPRSPSSSWPGCWRQDGELFARYRRR